MSLPIAASTGVFLICLSGVLAAELREVQPQGIGFIGPIAEGNPPATTPCAHFAYGGSVGFPYRNRSVVVDLGRPTAVHKLTLLDDVWDHGGDSPLIRKYGIEIYTSDDNRSYAKYPYKFRINIRSAKSEGAFDAVVIEDLDIFARYIKLHADLPEDGCDFANKNLQKMVRVFRDPDRVARIVSLATERYVAGSAQVRATVELPKADRGPLSLELAVGPIGARPLAQLKKIALASSGVHEVDVDLKSQGCGPRLIEAVITDAEGRVLARASARLFLCSSVVRDPGPEGSPVASRPGKVVLLDDVSAGRPIPLPVSGWYAVTVGLVGGDTEVDARLGSEGAFRRCRLETWGQKRPGRVLGESLVGCRELKDAALEIRLVKGKPARVAFVRLLGLSAEEIELAKAAAVPNDTPRVTVNNDGFSLFFGGVNSREALTKMLDRYAGKRLYSYDWGLGPCSTFTYDTKVGTIFGSNVKKFWRQGDKRAADAVRKLIAEGNDPLRVIVEHGHRIGLRIHASFRMNANYSMPVAKTFNGEFWWRHQDCRLITKYGQTSSHLSYAYPEVRRFRLAIIKEAAGYGVDGIHLDFLRHPPFFGLDKPLIEAYRKRYGVDPPKRDAEDERWYQLRAGVMTEFIREVRAALDEVGRKAGKRLELSASMEYRNFLEQGLDVARWVRDGLVDNISPGVHGLGGSYFPIRRFAEMVRGTKCKLFPRLEHTLKGHDPTPESERGEVKFEREVMTLNRYRARALELYDEGADGIYLFNTGGLPYIDPLSDVNGLRAWRAFEAPLVEWFDEVPGEVGK